MVPGLGLSVSILSPLTLALGLLEIFDTGLHLLNHSNDSYLLCLSHISKVLTFPLRKLKLRKVK